MKYILKTEVNKNGNTVLSKEKRSSKIVYLAKDENGNTGIVDRQWVLRNRDNILNISISSDGKISFSNDNSLEKQLEIIKSIYQEVFSEATINYSNGTFEFNGYTSDSGEMLHSFEIDNLYDLELLFHKLYEIGNNFDPDYEAKVSMGKEDFYKDCSEITDEDIEEDDDYRYLQWRYEAMVDYHNTLKNMAFGSTVYLRKKGYDGRYAKKLNELYGEKGLEDVLC